MSLRWPGSRPLWNALATAFWGASSPRRRSDTVLLRPTSAERLAARFAAKEAGMKAIGMGLRHGVTWHDVEVVRKPGSRPELRYSGWAAEFAARLGCKHSHLSMTHTAQ